MTGGGGKPLGKKKANKRKQKKKGRGKRLSPKLGRKKKNRSQKFQVKHATDEKQNGEVQKREKKI